MSYAQLLEVRDRIGLFSTAAAQVKRATNVVTVNAYSTTGQYPFD